MSFIKNNNNHFCEFENGNHHTPSVQKKTPSVAFFYKNTGLYSPQNHESKQSKNIWKQEYLKGSEKNKSKNISKKKNFMKKKEPTQSLYFSTQKAI